MKITIRNRFIMFLFGWGVFPSYVTANHKVWWHWSKEGRAK